MKGPKQRRHTVFIYCEGKTDHLFVGHLKRLYLNRGSKSITLKKGTGGGLSAFISCIIGNAQVRDYDEKYIVLDADDRMERELEKDQDECGKKYIQLIWQRPCLEGLFLKILDNKPVNKNSQSCKSVFYKRYANNRNLSERLLDQLFTKGVLDKKGGKYRNSIS